VKIPVVRLCLILSLIAALFSGCTRDPNVRKQKYLQSGQTYLQEGRLDEAEIQFRNALRVDPAYAEAYYQLALVDLTNRKWQRASQELARVIELQPENAAARVEMAKLLIAAGNLPQAQEQVDWLIQRHPNDATSHAVAADLLAARGSFPTALEEAEKAVSLDPVSGDLFSKLALLELRNNQPESAETNFKKAVDLSPRAVGPRLMLANFYQARGRFAEAEGQLRESIALNPQSPDPVAALARLYLAQQKRTEAEGLLIRAKYGFGENSAGYRLLGDFYLGLGELDKATREYRALYEAHPKDLLVKKNFADLLIHTKQFQEAGIVDDEILKADPGDSDGLIFRGELQVEAEDSSNAISTLQTVIKNDPNNALGHYHLGVAFQEAGNLETAESEWRAAVRLRPDLLDAQRELALFAMRRGDMTALEQASSEIIKLRPGSPDGYALRAVSEINQKHFVAAEADAQKAIEVAPGRAAGYVQRGNVNFAQKRFKEAESAFQLALDRDAQSNDALRGLLNTFVARGQIDAAVSAANVQIGKAPDSSGFYDLLGTVLLQQKKDLAGAKAALTRSVQLDKNNTDALTKLGRLQLQLDQTDDAIATLQQAARDNPHESVFYVMLGQIFQSRRDWGKAADFYQKALGIRRDEPVASCNLAYVMLQSGGDLDIALSLAQTARKRMPESPEVADTLGWIYYQKGAYRSAVDSLQAALTLAQGSKFPDDPRFHYHLGMAYAKSGDTARAREQFQKMLKMNPDSNEASDARKQLLLLNS
jgi:tetratricopeptide (TPR) repeat protein